MAEHDAAGRWKDRFGHLGRRQIGGPLALVLFLVLGVLAAFPAPLRARPTLAAISPAPGSTITSLATITLRFTQPMDRQSVERAIRISPSAELRFRWAEDDTVLAIEPAAPLTSGARYTLSLGEQAQGQSRRTLGQAAQAAFAVVDAQGVLLASPAPGARDIAPDAPISLLFSRPMVAEAQVGVALAAPPLRLDPATPGEALWLDAETLLFRPAAPLAAGAAYTATLAAGLPDAVGGRVATPYVWRFSTAAPRVLAAAPPSAAQRVSLGAPLSLTLSQPVPFPSPSATLAISPSVDGAFSQSILPDSTQVITFTPAGGWMPDTAYSAALTLGGAAQPAQRWEFRTAPRPLVAGRYPGQGQPLALGQPLRVIFSTPVDQRVLERALQITPPVEGLAITASGNEARISAAFAASSAYTLTLPADLTDMNGAALGVAYDLRFQTADAPPSLEAPAAQAHVLRIPPGALGPQIASRNLAVLSAALYRLDADSAVRMLGFAEGDWQSFDPARYGLPLVRGWDARLRDVAGGQVLALGERGPVPAGMYYLRLRAVGTLRLDLLLSVSDVDAQLRQSRADVAVWATLGGAPAEGLPVAIYREGALVAQGATGGDGVFRAPADGSARLVALVGDGGLALGEAVLPSPALPLTATLLTDRREYAPGDRIYVGGFVRGSGLGAAVPDVLSGTLALRSRATTEQVAATAAHVGAGGVISASLALPPAALPGRYMLALSLGSQLFTADLAIVGGAPPPHVAIDLPPAVAAGQPLTATLRVEEGGLPLPLAPLTWTLALGPDDAPSHMVAAGQGAAGLDGRLTLVLSDSVQVDVRSRYTLAARLASATVPRAPALAAGVAAPAAAQIGIRLDRQIVPAGQPFDVALALTGAAGEPLPNRALSVELSQLPDGELPSGRRTRMLAKSIRTRDDGTASIALSAGRGGLYEIAVTSADEAGRPSVARAHVWLAGDETGWPAAAGQRLPLQADRASYRAGEVAQLLIPADFRARRALLIARQGDRMDVSVRDVRPGGVITVPLGLGASEVAVELLLAGQGGVASATLAVEQPPALQLSIAHGTPVVPRATLPITITATDAEGRGVATDLALSVYQRLPSGESRLLRWQPDAPTDPGGVLSFPLTLPAQPAEVIVQAWAAGAGQRPAEARQSFVITSPLSLDVQAPSVMRQGDQAEIRATLRSTSHAAQAVDVTLGMSGVRLAGGEERQRMMLDPGAQVELAWRVSALDVPQASVRVVALGQGGTLELRSLSWDVQPSDDARLSHGALVDRSWSGAVERSAGQTLDVRLSASIQSLEQQALAQLTATPQRAPEESAALLQLAAPLTSTADLAYQALAELLAQQGADGGWRVAGAQAADPDLTLFAVESLALARRAGVVVPDAVLTRGAAALGEVPRAYIASLLGPAPAPSASAASGLRPTDMALLLLSLPRGSAAAAELAGALQAQVAPDAAGSYVPSASYGGSFAATALVARAFAVAQPDMPALPEMRRWLAASYGPQGWGGGMRAVRAIAAMRGALPERASLASLQADGRTIQTGGELLRLPAAPISRTLVLTATAQGVALLGYSGAPLTPSPSNDVHALREYLDPRTGQPIALDGVALGDVVQVRLTYVVARPLDVLRVEDSLPGGFRLIGEAGGAAMRWGAAGLPPGVYQRSYLMQAAHRGQYRAPATVFRTSDGAVVGLGRALMVRIR